VRTGSHSRVGVPSCHNVLIVFPQVAHGRVLGAVVVPAARSPVALACGSWRWCGPEAVGNFQRPELCTILVLLVIAGYTGLFLALMTLKL